MFRSMFVAIAILLMAVAPLMISACSGDDDDNDAADDDIDDDADDDADDDGDDDAGDDDTWPPLPDDDTSEEDWDNLSDELGDGEVRAGVIASQDELIGGPSARGRLGDY